jgi:hypothetical protein
MDFGRIEGNGQIVLIWFQLAGRKGIGKKLVM